MKGSWRWIAGCGLGWGLAVLMVSCVRKGSGNINAQGYRHENYGYHVLPLPGQTQANSLMGPDWILDNYYFEWNRLVPKTSDEYTDVLELDVDGDGEYELERHVPLYDLRFVHRHRDAVIWLRTFPISGRDKEKDLDVLTQGFVGAVAGAGYERVRLHPKTVVLSEKRYAADIVSHARARVAGQDAFIATIDVANIDQLKMSPGTYTARVELVLLRTPLPEVLMVNDYPRAQKVVLPVLMLAGYKNQPGDFANYLPQFHEFLGRIELDGRTGFEGPFTDADAGADADADAGAEAPPAVAAPALDGGLDTARDAASGTATPPPDHAASTQADAARAP